MSDTENKVNDLVSKLKEKGLIPEKREAEKKNASQQKQSITGDGDFKCQAGHDLNVNIGGDLKFHQRPDSTGPYSIACPNCKNEVAYNAHACLTCGFPITDFIKKSANKEEHKKLSKVLLIIFIVLLGSGSLISFSPEFLKEYLYYCIFAGLVLFLVGIKRLDILNKDM